MTTRCASRTTLLLVLLVLVSSAGANQRSAGGNEDGSAGVTRIGLIDMAYVFQNYAKFAEEREDLVQDLDRAEAEARRMQRDLAALKSEMEQLAPGSDDARDREMEIRQLEAELTAHRDARRKEFLRREAETYQRTFVEIQTVVAEYAEERGYTLVLRFNREPVEEVTDTQRILKSLNRQVIYHQREDDMSDEVVRRLNDAYLTGTISRGGEEAEFTVPAAAASESEDDDPLAGGQSSR